MAIVLNSTPATYSSAHGDLVFTAYEATKANDPTTYPNYKYVCDVYIGGVLVHRARTFPNPVNKRGIFNIGPVVRAYVAMSFNPVSGIRSQEFGSGVFFIDVQCKFGEEYSFTTYTNLTEDSVRTYFNHYNDQITGTTTDLADYTDLPATNRPYDNTVRLTAARCFIPYFPTSTSDVPVEVKTYDASNTLVDTQSTTFAPAAAFTLQQFNVSPVAINATFASLITAATKYYVVTIGSVDYKFTLVCEHVYTPYTLHFLNQLGGFESFDFRKVSRKTYEVEKKSFTKLPYTVDDSGNVNYASSNGVVNDTKTVYSSLFQKKMRLTTDIMKDTEYEWLKELQFSPMVYFDSGSKLIPVTIDVVTYETKKYINDKITAMGVDIDFGITLNAQYR